MTRGTSTGRREPPAATTVGEVTGEAPGPGSPAPAGPRVSEPFPARPEDTGDAAQEDRDDATTTPPVHDLDLVSRALQVVGSIVAPTTLVTALFFYFGLLYAVSYYRHFGVNHTVLDLPTQGFLILSASTATLPLALLAGTALLALWIHGLPVDESSGTARQLLHRGLLPAVVVVGVGLLGLVAVETLVRRPVFPAGFREGRGLSLSLGVVLLVYAVHLRRALAPARPAGHRRPAAPVALHVATWVCVTVLVGVGLFWAVGSYAVRMGTEGARDHAFGLRCAPDVVLYSERRMDLRAAGVPEEAVPDTGDTFHFRYPGLKLVPQEGEQYLLIPADWAPGSRPAVLLPRSDGVRLEFTPVAC